MDIQYYGGNCITLTGKDIRIVVDDNLSELGLKSITKPTDVMLYTGERPNKFADAKLLFAGPGEYEVSDLSIVGIAARSHMDEEKTYRATMYKIIAGEINYLITGHIHPELSDEQLEAIGMVDVMVVPIGGNGFTVDPTGALQLIKKIEPKIVVPTHYADEKINYPMPQTDLTQALKNMGTEPSQTVSKLRFKTTDAGATTQLIIIDRS